MRLRCNWSKIWWERRCTKKWTASRTLVQVNSNLHSFLDIIANRSSYCNRRCSSSSPISMTWITMSDTSKLNTVFLENTDPLLISEHVFFSTPWTEVRIVSISILQSYVAIPVPNWNWVMVRLCQTVRYCAFQIIYCEKQTFEEACPTIFPRI